MKQNHYNLTLRFLLEMIALFVAGYWGWSQHEGWWRIILVVGLPIVLATVWGVFAVPNDPSRSGKTVVKTPGWIRLVIELFIFSFAAWALYDMGYYTVAWIFWAVTLLHYIFSIGRIKWLIKQ